eukprot:3877478-Karenia_brevis.AAC.1
MSDLRDSNLETVSRAGRPERGREVREISHIERETINSRGRWEPSESPCRRAIRDRDRDDDWPPRPPTPERRAAPKREASPPEHVSDRIARELEQQGPIEQERRPPRPARRSVSRPRAGIDPRDLRTFTSRTLNEIDVSQSVGDDFMTTALEYHCRVCQWHKYPYYQSLETTGFCGGKERVVADGFRWLELGQGPGGGQSFNRVCARFVQISPLMTRDEIYLKCKEFGEVVGIYFIVKQTEQGYFTYDGTGFVQFRDPRDLRRAWNSRQIREKTKFTCQRL